MRGVWTCSTHPERCDCKASGWDDSADRAARAWPLPANALDRLAARSYARVAVGREFFSKQDRLARLIRVAWLLFNNPKGLTIEQIADRVGRTSRTVYRDIRTLDLDLGIPVVKEDGRWRADGKAFLPPLKLTLQEAVALFLSARLMARFADKRDDRILNAFGKLAAILPPPIAHQVDATTAELSRLPADPIYQQVLECVATAWAEGRKVRIWYPWAAEDGRTAVYERLVSPYFLEPNPTGHSCYLIGHDAYTNATRVFKVERIQRAELTGERFVTPADFDAAEQLRQAWGVSNQDPVEVRLLVHEPGAVRRIRESRWHPSQQETELPDGRLEVTYRVSGILEILPWILGWGSAVEVLGPVELRQRVAETARQMAQRYQSEAATGATA